MSAAEHSYTCRDGAVLTWTGRRGDICTECERVFSGIGAFDRHLRRPGRGVPAEHVGPESAGLEPDGTGKWRLPLHYPGLARSVRSLTEVYVTGGGAV